MGDGGAQCCMDWRLVASLTRGGVEIVIFVDNFSVY